MQVFLCLFYTNEKFCVLKGRDELDQFDDYLIQHFQNEEELRRSDEFRGLIQAFQRNNRGYIDKIKGISQKKGRIIFLYQDEKAVENCGIKRYYHLTPVYGEDVPKSETLADMTDRVFSKLKEYASPNLLTEHVLEDCSFFLRRSLKPDRFEELEHLKSVLKYCTREMYERELENSEEEQPFHEVSTRILELLGESIVEDLDQNPLDAYFKLRKIDESVMNIVRIQYSVKKNSLKPDQAIPVLSSPSARDSEEEEIEIADPVEFFARVQHQRQLKHDKIFKALEPYREKTFSSAFWEIANKQAAGECTGLIVGGLSDLLLDYYENLDRDFSGDAGQTQLLAIAEEFPDLLPGYKDLKCIGALPTPPNSQNNKQVLRWWDVKLSEEKSSNQSKNQTEKSNVKIKK